MKKKQFHTTTTYNVLERITVGALLKKKDYYSMCYYVVDEDEDPLLIRDSMHWLNNQSPKTKVYILKFRRESSNFTK